MDIPLPSDNNSKERDKHGSKLLPDKPKRNADVGRPYENHAERTNSRFQNSSNRKQSSSYQNWNSYESKRGRNKNNCGRNSLSNYEDEKMHNSSYANRGANYAANIEFQGTSGNFNSNMSHEYGSEGFKTNMQAYHDPTNVQQNSSKFNHCLNTMNSVNMPGYGYGGIYPANQSYDSSGINSATSSCSMNNIPPNYNYGSPNLNVYNNAPNYSQLNPIIPPVMSNYNYSDVNLINLPTNMCSTQPPESYLNYNATVQGVLSSDNTSNYSSFPSESKTATCASLDLPMPPLPPVLPKTFNKIANVSVSEVPLPKMAPIAAITETVPTPLSSALAEISKNEISLDCQSLSQEVPSAIIDIKSNLQDSDFKESKSDISDVLQSNPALGNSEIKKEIQNKEVGIKNNKLGEKTDHKLDIIDSNCELGPTIEENKIEKTDFEDSGSEKVTAIEVCDVKKVTLAFSSNVKTVNIEKSFLDSSDSNSPRKKTCNFPCLGKEEAKKRLRAFSATKLLVKEKIAKPSRINPLQDDQDDNENNSQTNHSTEDKKETTHKKKKTIEMSSIAQIKEKEERVKAILNQNNEIIKSYNSDLASTFYMYDIPGINFFDISNVEKFEEKNNAVQKFLELKREEEAKNGVKEAKNGAKEKRRSRSVSRDRDRRRDKKYSRSDSHERRHEESNRVKKPKGSQRKEVELPKSWNDVKKLGLKMEDLCNLLQKDKYDHSMSKSHSPSFEAESGTHKRRGIRKFNCDPFPFFSKSFRDFQAIKREERSPLSKDYNSFRQDNIKKSYRGCNVQYTSAKPTICYNIDSERYDHHYLSQKALKYKNSSDIMHIIDGFHKKSFKRQDLGHGVESTKTRMWYPENWMKATKERSDIKEIKCLASEQKNLSEDFESYGHSSKMASSNLNKDDKDRITAKSCSDTKQYNEKVKYRRNVVEVKKQEEHYDEKIDSDLDMHARFFTEENDEDEEIVDKDDNCEFGVDKKQNLNESKESYAEIVGNTESTDEKCLAENFSKSFVLAEEYKAFMKSTFDNKTLPEIKHKSTGLIKSLVKEELNLKSLSNELIKELKAKAHSDVPAHKVYVEVKAILKASDSNEGGYEKLKKLKKKLKQRMDKEKKHKKKAKKELKEIKKGKKTKKVLPEEIEPFKKKEDSFDDISPEQDMLDYEVIEYENYSDEREHQNIGSEKETSEKGKGKNSELSEENNHDSQFSLEGNDAKFLHQEDEVSDADQEKDKYSPSSISQYSEEGIDVDSNIKTKELSTTSVPSSSPQLDSADSPSSRPYSPSNMFDDDEYAPSPYSPSSPQSSGSFSPPLSDRFSKNKQETILNSIPIPPTNFNKLPDYLAQQEGCENFSDKIIELGDLKESSINETVAKGFQPVTFKLNLTRQTNAKLLQKPSLAGFNLDEEEEIENTKSPLPIAEIKDLPLLAFETKEGEVLLPQIKAKSEKHLVESIKYSENDNLNNDDVKTRKRELEKKKRKSPSPRKTSRHRSRSRSRSPKEYRRKSYEKAISKSPCRKEKSYRDNSPLSSNSYRRKERSRTPENYKQSGNKTPSATEKQRYVRSQSMEKIREVYETDACINKKSKSRTPSPVTKWKKVKSPPPKKFRQKLSNDRDEEPYSEHPYKKEIHTEDYSATSSHNRSRSRERSPKDDSGIKHKEDENFYPISSISNLDFTNGNNEFCEHHIPLEESLKQDISPEYEEYNHHGSEYGNSNYWGYNTNQVPRQVAGSSQVVRIGNVLQVLPQDSSLEDVLPTPVAPPGAIHSTSKDLLEIGLSSAIMPRKMVQTGNIIEVVPAGISEQELLGSNSSDKKTVVLNSGLVPQIPLPDKPSPQKSMHEKSIDTKISPEKPLPDKSMYENTSLLKILPEKLSPLIKIQDNMLHHMETLTENLSPLKSPDDLSPMQSPVMPLSTSASLQLPASNTFVISSSFVASPMSRNDHNIDGAASTYAGTLSNQSTSSAIVNALCYGETFATQENTAISLQDSLNSTTMELRTAHVESPLISSLESQQQQHAIFSAAVSAARGETAGDHALAQLLSVLQQQRMAPGPVNNLLALHPSDQPMMNVDLTAFKQQKRERKERKQKEKEQRQARREKRRLDREYLELKPKSILSDDEDDIVMKEAITEVPDLGSPVPEYEIYNDEEDEEEQELEKKDKPALIILPPPEKGILVSPSYRILNLTKGKSVSFADGVIPGDGTDVSGGEEIHSPPPPNAEPEKKKGKKFTKKKRVKVKRIKQFKFGNSRMDSPPPPPAFPPNGNVIKLYQGCSYASCTAPGTYVVYTQRPVEANVDGGAKITEQVTIPPGMLLHAAALSRAFPPVEGIIPAFTSYPQVMESPIVPI